MSKKERIIGLALVLGGAAAGVLSTKLLRAPGPDATRATTVAVDQGEPGSASARAPRTTPPAGPVAAGPSPSPAAEPSGAVATAAARAETAPPTTPEAETQLHVDRLTQSGPADAAAQARAKQLATAWQRVSDQEKLGLQFSEWKCYRAGCYGSMKAKQPGELEQLTQKLAMVDEFGQWPGGKFRSGIISEAGGGAHVTWVLFGSDT